MGGPGSGRKKGYVVENKPKRHPNQITAVAVAENRLPYAQRISSEADKFSAMVRKAKGNTL